MYNCNIFIMVLLFYNVIFLHYINNIFNKYNKDLLLITVISCNRYQYLNTTINSLLKHIVKYENELLYTIIYFDQGTIQRYFVVKKYQIHNSFFMNPSEYSLSFNIIFSYLYSQYILFLEEDWKVIDGIEKVILYASFIKESMLILKNYNHIYGMLLREIKSIKVNYSVTIKTDMGKHILNVLCNMKDRYSFTNGASVYRCKDLLKIKIYKSEHEVSQYFKRKNYKLGFTYKGRKGMINSSSEQSVMMHIGKISTKTGLCNISLY